MYYPTMLLCLENSPLIRIWVKCTSACTNPGRKGAERFQPTQMARNNVIFVRRSESLSRRVFIRLPMVVLPRSHSLLKQGWWWIRFIASKQNICGFYVLKWRHLFRTSFPNVFFSAVLNISLCCSQCLHSAMFPPKGTISSTCVTLVSQNARTPSLALRRIKQTICHCKNIVAVPLHLEILVFGHFRKCPTWTILTWICPKYVTNKYLTALCAFHYSFSSIFWSPPSSHYTLSC